MIWSSFQNDTWRYMHIAYICKEIPRLCFKITVVFLRKPCFPVASPRNLLGWYFTVYSVRTPFGWLGGSHSKVRESSVGLTIFKEDGALGTANETHSQHRGFWMFQTALKWNISPGPQNSSKFFFFLAAPDGMRDIRSRTRVRTRGPCRSVEP